MSAPEAARLFTRLAGRPGLQPESTEVTEVVGLLGGLPVLIAPVAGQLRQHRTWRVSDLGARLARSGGRLGLPASERATGAERGEGGEQDTASGRATVADALGLSYRAMPAGLQRMFRLLALHPGPDVDPYSAAALDDTTPEAAGSLLEELFGYHLIDEVAPERYRFHDLVRDYALTQVAGLPDDAAAAERRLLGYYLSTARAADRYLARRTHTGMSADTDPPADTAGPGLVVPIGSRADAFAWMDGNHRHLHAAAEYARDRGHREHAIWIPAFLDEYLTRRGRWQQLCDLHQLAARAAGKADPAARARALCDLGGAQYMGGDLDGATRNLDEALALYAGLGDPLGRAQVLRRQGLTAFAIGRYEDAERTWSSALGLFRQVGDRRGEADTRCRLGLLQYETGQIAAALESQTAARDMCAELDDPLGQANALCYLGEVQRELGRHAEAIASTAAGLALYRELEDPFTQVGARCYLGAALRAAGRITQARAELDAALAGYQEMGDDYDEAGVRNQIGMLQTQAGDFGGAADSLGRALAAYERWGSENGKAEVLNSMGELAMAGGDAGLALRHHAAAAAIAADKGIMREEARARAGTGRAYLAQGRRDDADGELRAAHAIYDKLQAPEAARLAMLLENP
jgi:tetratricopeptide (TPR) repeat protein